MNRSLLLNEREPRLSISAAAIAAATGAVVISTIFFQYVVSGALHNTPWWPWPTITHTGEHPPTSYVMRLTLGFACVAFHVIWAALRIAHGGASRAVWFGTWLGHLTAFLLLLPIATTGPTLAKGPSWHMTVHIVGATGALLGMFVVNT